MLYDAYGAATEIGQAISGHDEYTAKDFNKARRLTPLQNTFYLNWAFDWLEQTAVEEMNLPEKAGETSAIR